MDLSKVPSLGPFRPRDEESESPHPVSTPSPTSPYQTKKPYVHRDNKLSLASTLPVRPSLPYSSKPTGPPPLGPDTPLVFVHVPRRDLLGSIDNGLQRRNSGLFDFLFPNNERVSVEGTEGEGKDFVFFTPYDETKSRLPSPTEYIHTNASNHDDSLVLRTHDFEISFVGMSVVPMDLRPKDGNELLLYSVQDRVASTESSSSVESGASDAASTGRLPEVNTRPPSEVGGPNVQWTRTERLQYSLSPHDIPFIHYDPVIDGNSKGTEPNVFVSVPASKAVYMQHPRETLRPSRRQASVNVRFHIMELDDISDESARAVSTTLQAGEKAATQFLQPLSLAISAARSVGREGLRNYCKPDRVLSTDLTFLLADPERLERGVKGLQTKRVMFREYETFGNFLRVRSTCK